MLDVPKLDAFAVSIPQQPVKDQHDPNFGSKPLVF